jgi:hypothetical protein
MRENRLYGSEGGEAKSLPYPYPPSGRARRLARSGAADLARAPPIPAGGLQAAPLDCFAALTRNKRLPR